jgi:hypothetical protein
MSAKMLTLTASLGAWWLLSAAPLASALAQTAQSAPYAPRPHARPRIVITPQPLLYRRCIDWLELQYRPSGTVLYPQYRCWWVRG